MCRYPEAGRRRRRIGRRAARWPPRLLSGSGSRSLACRPSRWVCCCRRSGTPVRRTWR